MAYNLKEVARKPERFTGGHRMCAGCGAPIVVRQILRALKPEDHAVIGAATGCLEVCSAMERGHDMVYVCYDNGAYMNTGTQRSSATPKYADCSTSPAGKKIPGKAQWRKELTDIMASHHIPYVAQTAAIGNMKDLYEKSEKALYTPGPAFLNVLSPCGRNSD